MGKDERNDHIVRSFRLVVTPTNHSGEAEGKYHNHCRLFCFLTRKLKQSCKFKTTNPAVPVCSSPASSPLLHSFCLVKMVTSFHPLYSPPPEFANVSFLLDWSWPCRLLTILPYDSELTFRPSYTTVHFLASVMVIKTPWHLCLYK